jgi:hypothetical protein
MISPNWRIKEKERIKERRNRCYNDKCLAYLVQSLKPRFKDLGIFTLAISSPNNDV